ncbi:hypothetical protein ACFYU9_36300 [Streptomyces sp. NPDC004327]|uniref:hypothetical protein n=1 Tax=Streptomyces sp. NPDC004327 TaxID=3364699 RepID=UPI0036BD5909
MAAALVLGALGVHAGTGPAAYRTASDARPVGSGAVLPGPGTYTDSIAKGETHTYRVRLDGTSNVYLSAVLAPAPGKPVDVVDGLSLSLRTPDGTPCGMHTDIRFYGDTARPIADYVSRRAEPGRDCQEPGEYVFVVEGVGRAEGAPGRRTVELGYVVEPVPGEPAPPAPTAWRTEPPAAFGTGQGRAARGGTGFNDAGGLGGGSWRDELRPGESRFYRVPVDWGQQLFVRARFGNATAPPGRSALPDGLRLALYNPARGAVDETKGLYTGDPASLSLATAPAAYANRTAAATNAVGAMRFAGTYYVQLTLDRAAPTPVPVTLDLAVTPSSGHADPGSGSGPGSAPGSGLVSGPVAAAPDPTLRAIGITGVTAGTVLVAGLGAWPLVQRTRRRTQGRHARGA